jgi:hypothetical protein
MGSRQKLAQNNPAFRFGKKFATEPFAIHEFMGIARLYINNYLGWNDKYRSH